MAPRSQGTAVDVCVCEGRGGPRARDGEHIRFSSLILDLALRGWSEREPQKTADKGSGGRGSALAEGPQGGVGRECGCPWHAPPGPATRCPSGEGRGLLPGRDWLHVSESNRSQKRMGNSELPSALKSNSLAVAQKCIDWIISISRNEVHLCIRSKMGK